MLFCSIFFLIVFLHKSVITYYWINWNIFESAICGNFLWRAREGPKLSCRLKNLMFLFSVTTERDCFCKYGWLVWLFVLLHLLWIKLGSGRLLVTFCPSQFLKPSLQTKSKIFYLKVSERFSGSMILLALSEISHYCA